MEKELFCANCIECGSDILTVKVEDDTAVVFIIEDTAFDVGCTVYLSKESAVELANKILNELVGVK